MNEQEHRAQQAAKADLQALCAKHGRVVMLRVMGLLQLQWAHQGLALMGVEEPTTTETAERRVAPSKNPGTARPAASAIGRAMSKLEGRHGEGQR